MTSNREIFRLLENNDLINYYEVLDFRENQHSFFLKLKILFIDRSVLFASEYFSIENHNYSYHWQDENNLLLIRWDNSPYHRNIETFPHHKHKNDKIFSSEEIGLEDVLNYIFKIIKNRITN